MCIRDRLSSGQASSAGISQKVASDVFIANYNDIDSVERILNEYADEIASIIIEPLAGNMGLIKPNEGFLENIRRLADKYSVLLIFDEVINGFRVHAGTYGSLSGVAPDITTFGKIIGGGLPMGSYSGSKEIMSNIAPLGDVYQAGTLSGNPIATAAGIAQLQILNNDAAYGALTESARSLSDGLSEIFENAGIQAVVPRVGSLLSIFFTKSKPVNFDEAQLAAENGIYAKFFHGMLKRGVALAPGPYEALFPSLAHTKDVIEQTLEIAEETISEITQK